MTVRYNPDRVRRPHDPMAAIVFPNGARFVPSALPETSRGRPLPNPFRNPMTDKPEDWGLTSKASLFVGLRTGVVTEDWPRKGQKLSTRMIRGTVLEVRWRQVGREYGGSFVDQMGHYIPKGYASSVAPPEPDVSEESIQIILFPGPDEPWEKFQVNVGALAKILGDDFAQESIIVEWVQGGVSSAGIFRWTDEEPARS